MPMVNLYAYLLERKLVTPMFQRLREGPPSPNFDPSKKYKHHFKAEGHTLKECYQLRTEGHTLKDLIDNKLIQFDNTAAPNIITKPLPPHQEGNVNAIIIVEETVLDFSSLSFLWKEGVIIRIPKPFPYEDSYRVPWKYDVSLISTQIGKEEACSNISLGISGLTRSGCYYTLEELERRRKEIGKGTAEPIRDRVMTKEAEEFLKITKNSEYIVI
ncbi:hypothetical protein SO802_028817 [Lithocarpus litseifolius]|uniref:Uncharacterized protein n=1 Tax=Lithocarpus litseifolius TaxID=425828 RepID=A0AAW2BT85_9ROSI